MVGKPLAILFEMQNSTKKYAGTHLLFLVLVLFYILLLRGARLFIKALNGLLDVCTAPRQFCMKLGYREVS